LQTLLGIPLLTHIGELPILWVTHHLMRSFLSFVIRSTFINALINSQLRSITNLEMGHSGDPNGKWHQPMVFIHPCYSSIDGIYPWYCKWYPLMVFIHPWYCKWHTPIVFIHPWYLPMVLWHPPIVFIHTWNWADGIVTSTHGIHSPMELICGIVTSTHGIHSPMELTHGVVTEKYYK